jgi:death on curing protein
MIIYLAKHDILYINAQVLQLQGTSSRILSESGLESALTRPQMAAYYENADIIAQAAFLIAGIALAHAFLDGNKRTALIAGYDFLTINGYTLTSSTLEFAQQIEALVNRSQPLDDVMESFIAWLRAHIQ